MKFGMVYPQDFEKKIGFDVVRHLLDEKCESQSGREQVGKMRLSDNFDDVRQRLGSTAEMLRIISSPGGLPLGAIYYMNAALTEIKAEGAFMSAENMHRLELTLSDFAAVRKFFSKGDEPGASSEYPCLARRYFDMPQFPFLIESIGRCIGKYGDVKDNASPELYDIRRRISASAGSMQRAIRKVLESAVREGIVDKDASPSLRDGRMVIPVSSMMKRRLNGIVHDESATGKTVFIEPAEVVEAGNRMRELEMEEHREVVRILMELSAEIRPYANEIIAGCGMLGELDFIRAKARFAQEIGGEMPVMEREPELDWFHAVHPVLLLSLRRQGREVVPLDIRLGGDTRILVISGPNAGGKSVCLKTVAIIQYMLQCGLLPSLYSNSHVGVFRNIFIDIGDEQSIENDLSTYSSHLVNMKYFLQNSDSSTLMLIDEMGSGTEPQIGGALAQAILARLNASGCIGVVTTHYQNLKNFAESEKGLVNGAMLYDRQHLKPMFRLSVGSPGSSFALEIARKIGLPNDVVDSAKDIVGSDYVDMDKYLLDIGRDRRYWANKRQAIKEKERKLDKLLESYEDSASDLKARRNEIIHAARVEAREILAESNRQLEKAIREIRESNADKEKTRQVREELNEYRRRVENEESEIKTPKELKLPKGARSRRGNEKAQADSRRQSHEEKALVAGDYVKMADGGVSGKILSISGTKAEVAFGGLRTFVDLKKLKRCQKPAVDLGSRPMTLSVQTTDDIRRRQLDFKNEIDVRGMRADEALQAVTYFIDDALQFNVSRVRILHGTGHGILKTLIRNMLSANKAVSSIRDEDVRFGGAGITVVDFD